MHSDGTGGDSPVTITTDQKIIEELVKIRILLEQQKNNDLFKKQLFFL